MGSQRVRPGFAADLSRHGARLAVVGPDGAEITYRELADRVAETAERLGAQRRLVLVAASNDVEPLVTYLAALATGHPVLLAPGRDDRAIAALVDAYDPDVVLRAADGDWRLDARRSGSAHVLHPDLALLLSTSGSTGSPKLVRLSATGLAANAAAIAEYLDIRDTDRACAALPMHYCYGLSVINSNLLRGAAVLLSDRSVTDPEFWSAFRRHGCTSLHGVPYTFELLDQVGFPDLDLPRLRYVTQAGGRLAPDTVRRYVDLGARGDWRFFVMYGQTEATARMAYLPPELAAAHPAVIGIPIPGGAFAIEDADGTGAGELVYSGPNVMLGYAEGPADLALGRTVDRLRTGDLARRRPDGLYELLGRRSRFVKPFGLRVDLDQVERLLADEGCTAAVSGTDDELAVLVANGVDTGEVRRFVASRLGLPPTAVHVGAGPIPRTSTGKIDHAAVALLTRTSPSRPDRRRPGRPRTVRDAFRSVFPIQDLPGDATFVGLGGDSLSYVRMATALQQVLDHLPAGWETMPIDVLDRLPRTDRRRWVRTETAVVLRTVAILLVVGTHIGLYYLLGGSHVLLAVAGWAFARFVLPEAAPDGTAPGARHRAILRCAARIAVPSLLWIAWRAAAEDDVGWQNVLLLNQFLDPAAWGYWYVETLIQILLLLALLFAAPAVVRLERAHPFPFALTMTLVALLGWLYPDTGNEFSDRLMSTHLVLWIFCLGWLAHRSTTHAQRTTTALLALLLVPAFFEEPMRGGVVVIGLLLLLVPSLPVPRWTLRPIGSIGAASLAIYLTHYAIYPPLLPHLPAVVVTAACVLAGIAAWWMWTALGTTLARGAAALTRRSRRDQPERPATPVPVSDGGARTTGSTAVIASTS